MKNELLCPPTILIKNAGLVDAWALAIYCINKYGMTIQGEPDRPNTKPSLTKDGCLTIEYGEKAIHDIFLKYLHPLYPQQHGLQEYIDQYELGSPEYYHANISDKKFDYTYTKRMRRTGCKCDFYIDDQCSNRFVCKYYNEGNLTESVCYIDQLKYIAEHLEPFNRRLQAITWDVAVDLDSDVSVPCLQRVQLRNLGNGYYEIFFDWRSRDLMKAYMWNIIALVASIDSLVQKIIAERGLPPLKLIKVTDRITAAHIYYPEWDLADKVPVSARLVASCLFI